ncbi:MAG TPA: laccase domain-containing protein, partial [Candidatus Berkiella sp.]|nr:laccase domain-containing protein [Candidatus Berkiella sp.]
MNGILPLWPAPTWIRAITTTREWGNLATHVNDEPRKVAQNRQTLQQRLHLLHKPVWLTQTHSDSVIEANYRSAEHAIEADGVITTFTQLPCAVLTADCLPLLLCDTEGTVVGAIHCGWRGILAGIIENAVNRIANHAKGNILAW